MTTMSIDRNVVFDLVINYGANLNDYTSQLDKGLKLIEQLALIVDLFQTKHPEGLTPAEFFKSKNSSQCHSFRRGLLKFEKNNREELGRYTEILGKICLTTSKTIKHTPGFLLSTGVNYTEILAHR